MGLLRSPSTAALLALALPAACATPGERHADAACAALRACECAAANDLAAPGGAPRTCEDRLTDALDDRLDRARAAGLTVDDACLEWWNEQWSALGCASTIDGGIADERACGACRRVHGDGGEGASCALVDGEDPCAQGLVCRDERCVDPCARHTEGEACDDGIACEEGTSCHLASGADAPICVADEGRACAIQEPADCYIPPPACPSPLGCVDGLCGPGRAPGAACAASDECAGAAICADGVCVEGTPRALVCDAFPVAAPLC